MKPLSLRGHACTCGASLHRDENAMRVMLAREFVAIAATGEAVLLGTPTWAVGSSRNAPRRKVLETRRQMGFINPK